MLINYVAIVLLKLVKSNYVYEGRIIDIESTLDFPYIVRDY